MLRILAGGNNRPYGKYGGIRAENADFLHKKTYIACLLTGKLPYRNKSVNNQILLKTNPRILTKIRSRSYILRGTNKPYERAKPIHEIIICGICGTTKNPANGKHIRSQGSVYNNVKMTIRKSPSLRLTATGYPVGAAICRPPKTQRVFPLYTAPGAVIITAKPRAKS